MYGVAPAGSRWDVSLRVGHADGILDVLASVPGAFLLEHADGKVSLASGATGLPDDVTLVSQVVHTGQLDEVCEDGPGWSSDLGRHVCRVFEADDGREGHEQLYLFGVVVRLERRPDEELRGTLRVTHVGI